MTFRTIAAAVVAASLLALPVAAQHDHDGHGHDHGNPESPMMDEAAMMEMWMKAATPGEQHAELNKLAGEWTAKMTSYQPGSDPVVTDGSATYEALYDGRVMKGTHTGVMGGFPHHGLSLEGFDNVTGEYWTIWVDNMGTGITTMRGHKQDDGSIEYKGTGSTPMGPTEMRMITRNSKNEASMELYMNMGEMGEVKGIEITYKRAG